MAASTPVLDSLPTRHQCFKPRLRLRGAHAAASLVAAFSFVPAPSLAWVLNINPAARAVYLQVGNGTSQADNTLINEVSLALPAGNVGNNTPQAMTSNSTQAISFFDNFNLCTPPAQVYVGGFYRMPAASTTTAVLQVSTPASLTNGADTIAFSQISWTSTALGSTTADIPAGTFNGGTLFLRNIAANTWVENCHTFSYANSVVVPAGVYTGRATYTLTAP